MLYQVSRLLVLSLTLSLIGCTGAMKRSSEFYGEIQLFVLQDAQTPPPDDALLFIGSSSIRLWDTLEDDFPQYNIIQRGFGGSQFSDVILFADELVKPYKAEAIVVFEGTNDIADGKNAKRVFNDYKKFIKIVRSAQHESEPPVPIFFIGATPCESRWEYWPQTRRLNSLVQNHAQQHEGLYYIDTPTPILESALSPGGPPARALFQDDLLHLSPKGYELWVEVITPQLEAVVPPHDPTAR